MRAAIEGAESVEEIRRLQRMLAQGFVSVPCSCGVADVGRRADEC